MKSQSGFGGLKSMNIKQKEAAQINMVEWLEHPNELGKQPYKIECTGNTSF